MQEIIPSYLQRIVEQIVVGISAWEKKRSTRFSVRLARPLQGPWT
jgi:hypothetical protein